MKLQLNGNLTIVDSKLLSDAEKAKVLSAGDGKHRAIRLTFLDGQGREVVLTGKLYQSKNGSLTARFNTKVDGFELVEVEGKQDESVGVAEELGL